MNDFILGPQLSTDDYFDQTLLAQCRKYGEWFPAIPPEKPASPVEPRRSDFTTDEEYRVAHDSWLKSPAIAAWISSTDVYVNTNYYDLARSLYVAHKRTGDSLFLSYARKVADSWWLSAYSKGGITRNFSEGEGTSPKFAGIAGLILRAIDGRPEMWDWINAYTRHSLDLWAIRRMNDPNSDMQLREAAFSLHFATWLAKLLPDTFPLTAGGTATNGAELRAKYLADVENVSVNYFGKQQYADGSWRWDDWYSTGDDGSLLKGIMQPFMIGLLLRALCDVHQLTQNTTVRESVKNQILKDCRHLYSDGPYIKDQIEQNSGKRIRGFHYFYHGGTALNPTRYEKGDISNPWTALEAWWLPAARQAISTILGSFGYAYKISGDTFFKDAGDEMYDSAYGGGDGVRAMMDNTAKNFNQHVLGSSSYKAWRDGVISEPVPQPIPEPIPQPVPQPLPQPSPDGTKATTIIDSEGATWTITVKLEPLRNGTYVGGLGSIYKYLNKIVYIKGTDDNWYKWGGSAWAFEGAEPGVSVPTPEPIPTPVPVPVPEPPPPPPPPPPVPQTRTATWPKQASRQNSILATQWSERYRLKSVGDGSAIFESVA